MKRITVLALVLMLLCAAAGAEKSIVYMTRDISPEGLVRIYEALGVEASGRVAVKMHLGEPGNDNHLKADFVEPLVTKLGATFVESNTYFGGSRMETAAHLQIAKDNGFTYAPVDILDAEGDITVPITTDCGRTEAYVGKHYENYDFVVSLTHYKGHGVAGIGGTFKNVGMGMASKYGKQMIHNNTDDPSEFFSTMGNPFQEKLVSYFKAIVDAKGMDHYAFVNVLCDITMQCDCESASAMPFIPNFVLADPVIADIGILASADPVALEKASFDLVAAEKDNGSAAWVEQAERMGGTHQFEYAAEVGIGSLEYELVVID